MYKECEIISVMAEIGFDNNSIIIIIIRVDILKWRRRRPSLTTVILGGAGGGWLVVSIGFIFSVGVLVIAVVLVGGSKIKSAIWWGSSVLPVVSRWNSGVDGYDRPVQFSSVPLAMDRLSTKGCWSRQLRSRINWYSSKFRLNRNYRFNNKTSFSAREFWFWLNLSVK